MLPIANRTSSRIYEVPYRKPKGGTQKVHKWTLLPHLVSKIHGPILWKLRGADKNIFPLPSIKSEAKMEDEEAPLADPTKKDMTIAWATRLAELECQVVPTAGSVDESAGLPTPSGHTTKEGLGVPALTASMVALKLEAPSVAVGCQEATVEELVEEDMVEGHP